MKASSVATDIETLLARVAAGEPAPVRLAAEDHLTNTIREKIRGMLTVRKPLDKAAKVLRMSKLGLPCKRRIWYDYNRPDMAEPLEGHTLLKFLIGDVAEAVLLFLAELSGHAVERQQEAVEWDGPNGWKVRGHIDAMLDGTVVDTKSASKYGFQKFKDGITDANDDFGYRGQLDSYAEGTDINEAGWLVMQKDTGKLQYAPHAVHREGIMEHADDLIRVIEHPEPPARHFEDVADGKSGNRKLDVACSYCPFKHECWPELRGFIYAKGPVWLTKVERTPDVPEITRGERDVEAQEAA